MNKAKLKISLTVTYDADSYEDVAIVSALEYFIKNSPIKVEIEESLDDTCKPN